MYYTFSILWFDLDVFTVCCAWSKLLLVQNLFRPRDTVIMILLLNANRAMLFCTKCVSSLCLDIEWFNTQFQPCFNESDMFYLRSCLNFEFCKSFLVVYLLLFLFNKRRVIGQVDDANTVQQKEYAMALCVILTLQVPQVIDRLDGILR
jgi:hypothetical protein